MLTPLPSRFPTLVNNTIKDSPWHSQTWQDLFILCSLIVKEPHQEAGAC